MASIMENLMEVLEKENTEYEKLLVLSREKTAVIIKTEIPKLEEIVEKEQNILSGIMALDKQREKLMQDVADVLKIPVEECKLGKLTEVLKSRPTEQQRMAAVHEKLKVTMSQMVSVNSHNRDLINGSLEMVEYNMNVLKSMKAAPETANYTKGAYGSGTYLGTDDKSFDAKQ